MSAVESVLTLPPGVLISGIVATTVIAVAVLARGGSFKAGPVSFSGGEPGSELGDFCAEYAEFHREMVRDIRHFRRVMFTRFRAAFVTYLEAKGVAYPDHEPSLQAYEVILAAALAHPVARELESIVMKNHFPTPQRNEKEEAFNRRFKDFAITKADLVLSVSVQSVDTDWNKLKDLATVPRKWFVANYVEPLREFVEDEIEKLLRLSQKKRKSMCSDLHIRHRGLSERVISELWRALYGR